MASNGVINTGGYDGRYLQFSWNIKSQSVANNTTTITWTLKGAGRTASGYDYYAGAFSVTIDGKNVYSYTGSRYLLSNGKTVASGEATITHNSNGSRSFSASVSGAIYYYSANATGSGSWDLTSIPRQATITSAPNFNDEENPTINYSNPAGNAVTSLQACISLNGGADIAYRDISKTGTSYKFNLTEAERNVLRNACTTANSRNVIFYVTTVIGGVTYYSTLTKTLSIVNAQPVISASVVDNGSVSTKLTGDKNKMIKGYNGMQASMAVSTLKGATIKSQSITNGSNTVNAASAYFDYTDSNSFVFKITDSRGNTTTKTVTVPMVNYIKLTCNLAADNPTTDGNMSFNISGNYFNGSFGAVSNSLNVQYRYKDDGGTYSAWTSLNTSLNGSTYNANGSINGLDYRTTYVIQARAIDGINTGGVETEEKKVKSITVFDWSSSDFNFNVPVNFSSGFTMNGADYDYIVEQGENNGWFYRKYNSGIAECWKLHYANGINAAASNYNGFYYSNPIIVKYPFTFVNLPTVITDGGSISNMNFTRVFGNYADSVAFITVGNVSVTNTDVTVSIRAIGKWK